MAFAIHTEPLNLISIVAAEYHDELYHQHQHKLDPHHHCNEDDENDMYGHHNNRHHHHHDDADDADVDVDHESATTGNGKSSRHGKNRLNHFRSSSVSSVSVSSFESRYYELKSVWELMIPTYILQMGSIVPGFAVASYIGHDRYSSTLDVIHENDNNDNGIVDLDGYTLASLTTNLFTLSLLQGLYTATDTLSPQAYGAGHRNAEVGYLAIRGLIASLIVVLPILIGLVLYMEPLLLYMGQAPESVQQACIWFHIYKWAIPFYALYQVTMKFLSAQNQMLPLVICCVLSTGIVLPMALSILGDRYGYPGTAMAIVIYQMFQSISLLLYLYIFQPHDPSTWPGLTDGFRNAVLLKPFLSYMALGAGGMLASSEWIYWETLSLMIGTFGIVPLSVHTIPTQLMMMTFMGPYSLGLALSIRLGATLPVFVPRAQQTVIDTFVLAIVAFGATSVVIYIQQDWLISLFTTSDAVIEGCHAIWWNVCIYSFCLSIYATLMGVCVGLGMQWALGIGTFIALWVFALPTTYYLSVIRDGGITMAWSMVWPPYILLPLALTILIVRADWDVIAHKIRIREGTELVEERQPSFSLNKENPILYQPLLSEEQQKYGSIKSYD